MCNKNYRSEAGFDLQCQIKVTECLLLLLIYLCALLFTDNLKSFNDTILGINWNGSDTRDIFFLLSSY